MTATQQNGQRGELTLRTLAMPADANAAGDIFGGWVLAQMDLAGGMKAHELARCRVVTVAMDGMSFHQPVKVGDTLCVYTRLRQQGRTSLTIQVEAWVNRQIYGDNLKVTEAEFKFVALDGEGRPRALPRIEAG